MNLRKLFYLARSQILYASLIFPVLIIAQKGNKNVLDFKINLVYFIGELVMSLALICFFLVIQQISKETIIAHEDNLSEYED